MLKLFLFGYREKGMARSRSHAARLLVYDDVRYLVHCVQLGNFLAELTMHYALGFSLS